MKKTINLMTVNFAEENNIDFETASKLVTWLEKEGVLDYDIVQETYGEPNAIAA